MSGTPTSLNANAASFGHNYADMFCELGFRSNIIPDDSTDEVIFLPVCVPQNVETHRNKKQCFLELEVSLTIMCDYGITAQHPAGR